MLLDLMDVVSKKPESTTRRCGGQCKLIEGCKKPIEPVIGSNGYLIISGSPTEAEDGFSKGFLGVQGKRIRSLIEKAGIDPDKCSYTYALQCHGTYEDKHIEACRILLLETIKKVNPHTILLFGQAALSSVISYDYGKAAGQLNRWVGFQIPSRKFNAWICPNYDVTTPYQLEDPAMDLLFDKYTLEALKKKSRPWKEIPDESKDIQIVGTEEAVEKINEYHKNKCLIAWDYETTGIKPDAVEQEIYTCSICSRGEETISFLWDDEVEAAMKMLLKSARTKKLGANMKYEHRWTKAKLGIDVKGWIWDTVLAGHVLDCRSGITSLKFQTYIRFGVPDYDSHVKKYFDSKGTNDLNSIKKIDQKALLTYNALDSLYTYMVAVDQMRELGHPLAVENS